MQITEWITTQSALDQDFVIILRRDNDQYRFYVQLVGSRRLAKCITYRYVLFLLFFFFFFFFFLLLFNQLFFPIRFRFLIKKI